MIMAKVYKMAHNVHYDHFGEYMTEEGAEEWKKGEEDPNKLVLRVQLLLYSMISIDLSHLINIHSVLHRLEIAHEMDLYIIGKSLTNRCTSQDGDMTVLQKTYRVDNTKKS